MSLLLILCAYIIKSRTSNTYLVTKNDRHCQTVQGFGNNKKICLFAFSQTCDNHVRITLIFMWYVYIEPRLNILSRKAIRHATKNKPKQLNWNFKWKEKQIWDFDFLSKIITSFFCDKWIILFSEPDGLSHDSLVTTTVTHSTLPWLGLTLRKPRKKAVSWEINFAVRRFCIQPKSLYRQFRQLKGKLQQRNI